MTHVPSTKQKHSPVKPKRFNVLTAAVFAVRVVSLGCAITYGGY